MLFIWTTSSFKDASTPHNLLSCSFLFGIAPCVLVSTLGVIAPVLAPSRLVEGTEGLPLGVAPLMVLVLGILLPGGELAPHLSSSCRPSGGHPP